MRDRTPPSWSGNGRAHGVDVEADPFAVLEELDGPVAEEWAGEVARAAPSPGSDTAINALLPDEGPGFRAYQRRVERRWGRPETIAALKAIGAAWQTKRPAGPRVQIGDISFRGGGPMPPHKSHQAGLDVDIRPLRTDARENPVRYDDTAYSRPLTQHLVDTIRGNPAARVGYVFFNDPQVKGVRPWPGHENHLHVRFITGTAPAAGATTVGAGSVPQTAGLAAARAAIAAGERDVNRLTDIVFFARHPERRGRKLDERERVQVYEWKQVRDQLIRPMLRTAPSAAGTRGARPAPAPDRPRPGVTPVWRPRTAEIRRFRALLPLIERYRGDIPLSVALGWIAVESGGSIGSKTDLNERGFFQLHPGESQTLKADHPRLSTDPDYSIRIGIELVKLRAKQAAALGFPRGDDLFWRMTKLMHWLPGGVRVILSEMRKDGIAPSAWDAIKRYVVANRDRLRSMFKVRWKKAYDPMKGIDLVDRFADRGAALAAALERG